MDYPDYTPEHIEGEAEPIQRSRWRVFVLRIVAAIALLSILYLYGVREALLFRRTPAEVVDTVPEAVLEAERLTVPVRIFVVEHDSTFGSERDATDVERLVERADEIWEQAAIDLELLDVHALALSSADVQQFFAAPGAFFRAHTFDTSNEIIVLLSGHLQGINGVAFPAIRAMAVADFTTVPDFRVFAHELGHILSLPHVPPRNLLMAQGANGTTLTTEEIQNAREWAEGLFGI